MQSHEKTFNLPRLQANDDAGTAYFYARRYANGVITIHVDGLGEVADDATILTFSPAGIEIGPSRDFVGHGYGAILLFSGTFADQRRVVEQWSDPVTENDPPLPAMDILHTECLNERLRVLGSSTDEATERRAMMQAARKSADVAASA